MNVVTIYGDGSSRKNGCGGYGFIILEDGKEDVTGSGFEHNTTNNRQELNAVIFGLQRMGFRPDATKVVIWSDSQYVINAFNEGWLTKWKANYWMTNRSPVKNQDLWLRLDSVVTFLTSRGYEFEWKWCRGHNGNHYNEIVDKLAQQASLDAGQFL